MQEEKHIFSKNYSLAVAKSDYFTIIRFLGLRVMS